MPPEDPTLVRQTYGGLARCVRQCKSLTKRTRNPEPSPPKARNEIIPA